MTELDENLKIILQSFRSLAPVLYVCVHCLAADI